MLLLRTYRIPRPVTVRVRDDYGGCRSWLEITRDLPFEGTPVLSDEEFERASEEIAAIVRGRRRPRLRLDHPLFAGAGSVLCVGIGGGGDVVGALGAARAAEAAGLRTRLGGVTWERRPIDPLPGPAAPRRADRRRAAARRGRARHAGDARARAASCSPSRTWRA